MMTFEKYQVEAIGTCMPTCENFSYMFLNLVGEVGEFASKVAKHIRKGEVGIEGNHLCAASDFEMWDTEPEEALKYEVGDILWQLAGLCTTFGWSLEDVALMNLEKLASRKQRGVIDGDGDNR